MVGSTGVAKSILGRSERFSGILACGHRRAWPCARLADAGARYVGWWCPECRQIRWTLAGVKEIDIECKGDRHG